MTRLSLAFMEQMVSIADALQRPRPSASSQIDWSDTNFILMLPQPGMPVSSLKIGLCKRWFRLEDQTGNHES